MISIIVPTYNVEPYIRRTLDSILAQTYKDIEIIAVNDGSNDGTGAVIDEYAARDPRVRPIHQANAGVTAARLAGVAAARGDYIGFVDGDDEIEPDMYKILLENAEKYDADISHCGYQMVFADGRINYFYNTGSLAPQDGLTALKELVAGLRIEPGLCNKLFRKNLFHSLLHDGVMDRSIKINEDLLMNYILFAQAKRSVFYDICPYHYIVRGDSASRAPLNLHRIYDPIKVKQYIIDMNIDGMQNDARRAYMSTCINVYNGLMTDKGRSFSSEEPKIRDLLREKKVWSTLLGKKQRLLYRMIISIPRSYRYIYRFYARFVLKNPYN